MFGIVANAGGGVSRNISYVSYTADNDTALTLPSFQAGDYAFIFQLNKGTITVPTTPSGFTSISAGGAGLSSQAVSSKISYRKMLSGDSRNITLSGTTPLSIALIFRPDFPSTGEDYGLPNAFFNTSNPPEQTVIGPSTTNSPYILFAHYASSGAVSPRTSSVTMDEQLSTSSQYIKYKIYNTGDTNETVTFDMEDEGTNILQSFYFQIQG
jgi:hypothetical protein